MTLGSTRLAVMTILNKFRDCSICIEVIDIVYIVKFKGWTVLKILFTTNKSLIYFVDSFKEIMYKVNP